MNKDINNKYFLQLIRGYKRKLHFIEKLGGKCSKCDYDENIAALNFHHTRDKKFALDIRSMSNRSFKNLEKEVEKCILFCSNCHNEHHNPELSKHKIYETVEIYGNEQKLKRNEKEIKYCIDCEIEILNTSERCKRCNDMQKRKVKNRPTKDELLLELKTSSQQKIAEKYGISRTTIRRWSGLLKWSSKDKMLINQK